jgi:hypothetical protein
MALHVDCHSFVQGLIFQDIIPMAPIFHMFSYWLVIGPFLDKQGPLQE